MKPFDKIFGWLVALAIFYTIAWGSLLLIDRLSDLLP